MRILIRTDGSRAIGTGHVMRMIALARAARTRECSVGFVCADLDSALERRLRTLAIPVERVDAAPGSLEDAEGLVELATQEACDWIVADGYGFGAPFQETIRSGGHRLLVLDDFGHCDSYCADLILNQNLSAAEGLYASRAPTSRLLLGPEYALLQPEFSERRGEPAATPDRARQILVTMGGADPVNATAIVMEALSRYPEPSLRARIVIGASNPLAGSLANDTDDSRLELLVGVEDMVEHMRWADIAVSAAGTTLLELCLMQVPTLLIALTDNQRANVEAAIALGICESAGWHADVDPSVLAEQIADLCRASVRRRNMIERAGQRVDGLGATRVLDAMGA
jgi:UDP-2,4-diacetamido-2,4,6-trideoxy-beta-L-altropyranose hydrolase